MWGKPLANISCMEVIRITPTHVGKALIHPVIFNTK